jgi:hypothetical protein
LLVGRPTSGSRFEVEQVEQAPDSVTYRGHVHLPGASHPLEVRVPLPDGAATARVEGAGEAAAELERAAAALVRAAVRNAHSADRPLPRKIVRWRG